MINNANGTAHTDMNMGQEGQAQPGTTLVGGIQNLFDKMKTPVMWFAIGYVVCKFADRKKVRVLPK